MKVMHVLNSRIYSGAEKVVCQIIHMFAGEVEMVYCSPESEIVDKMLAEQGVTYLKVDSLTPANLKRVIDQQKPDLIHAHDMRASFVAALCCGNIPLVSHIHNNAFDSRGLSVKSIAYLLAGMKARHILWVSRSSYEGYFFHKLFSKKSSVLYNIIDLKQVWEKRDQDKNTYQYDMIYIGRLTYQKNPQRLMQVCALAKKKKPDIRLAVVGTGELDEEIKTLCVELGLEKNVDFLGFQSNPMKMLSDSRCMILTSRWEGTPMCALEAMALGVPVISTPTDGLVDLLEDGVTGFLCENDQDLVDKIVTVTTDDTLWKNMSEAAESEAQIINDILQYKQAIARLY